MHTPSSKVLPTCFHVLWELNSPKPKSTPKPTHDLQTVFLTGTNTFSHKDKDLGYCHICGDIRPHNVGFTRTPHTHISIYDLITLSPSIYTGTVFIVLPLEMMGVSPTYLDHKKVKALCISHCWHIITERQTVAQRCFVEPAHFLSTHKHTHQIKSLSSLCLEVTVLLQPRVFYLSSCIIKCLANIEEEKGLNKYFSSALRKKNVMHQPDAIDQKIVKVMRIINSVAKLLINVSGT